MESELKKRLGVEIDTLRQARDELRVQIHLGAAEARQVWEGIEKNWGHLEARLKRVGHATQESATEIEEAAETLVKKIKDGYKHVRELL